ncbi:HPr kinase/phosphorylase [Chthonobacter rhizosphaerae]|uniref:HPr kinase/phosphorylase n=1 Tax=Chthonobacter rhizosphaerae TaxID=2735553 RepID=UPI0015EE5826|nr:serine/threonine protein kinase [Chthonobacter rhizosphaerae]
MAATQPTVHAGCVVLGDAGVLVRGPSQSGKTTLQALLVDRARTAGRFAVFVSDDRTLLAAHGGRLIARAPARLAGLREAAGRGIVAVAHVDAAVVRLVVDLVDGETLPRMPEEALLATRLAGVPVPRQPVPARSALVAALLVESALSVLGAMWPAGHEAASMSPDAREAFGGRR